MESVQDYSVEFLKVHPKNKDYFKDISGANYEQFKMSIQNEGVLTPLIIAPDMTVISGHQRLKACRELEFETVPVIIRHDIKTEEDKLINLLVANFGRSDDEKNLRIIADEYSKLRGNKRGGDRKSKSDNRSLKLTQEQMAKELGISVSTLNELLDIERKLTPEIKELLDEGAFTKTAASKILVKLSKPEQEELLKLFGDEIIKGVTQKQMQEYVNRIKELESQQNNIDELKNKISENEIEQQKLKNRISELVEQGTVTEIVTKEVDKPETLEKIKKLESELKKRSEENSKYSKELVEKHKLLSKAMGESTNYQLISHCSEITLKMLDFVKEMSKYDYMAESFNEIPNATRIEYEKCVGAVKKWADRILETIHPQDKIIKTIVYEDLSATHEFTSEDIEIVSEFTEPVGGKDSTITEIDSIEIREKFLRYNNNEKWLLSKIYIAENNTPQVELWRKIEKHLGVCDDNNKLLISYDNYVEIALELQCDLSNLARLKTRVAKMIKNTEGTVRA